MHWSLAWHHVDRRKVVDNHQHDSNVEPKKWEFGIAHAKYGQFEGVKWMPQKSWRRMPIVAGQVVTQEIICTQFHVFGNCGMKPLVTESSELLKLNVIIVSRMNKTIVSVNEYTKKVLPTRHETSRR